MKTKEYNKEYNDTHRAEIAFDSINKRCKPSCWDKYPTYTGCINNLNKEEFTEYFNSHSINQDIVYSVDKDSVIRNNKIYDLYNILILSKQLNQMLQSSGRCNSSSWAYMYKNNKYPLVMNINNKGIYFGQHSTLEDLYLQKSIINSHKTIQLFNLFHDQNEIDNHTLDKFIDGSLYKEYSQLASQISNEHKQKIDKLLREIF